MKILSIGNSFSQDAQRYLHQILAEGGVEAHVCNLYIGGCSLERHWHNVEDDAAEYLLEINGESTGEYVSIDQMLAEGGWDVITLQQASHYSGLPESYHPYIEQLAAYVRAHAPGARLMMHQTWAYEIDSAHQEFPRYGCDQARMYDCLRAAYADAAAANGMELIPCGDAIQALRGKAPFNYAEGGMSLCRDGYHMSMIYGRYLLGAVWSGVLAGIKLSGNSYLPATLLAPDMQADPAVIATIQAHVDGFLSARKA